MGQLQKKLGFLVLSSLATNSISGTGSMSNYAEKISSKSNLIAPINSSSTSLVDVALKNHVLITKIQGPDGHSGRSTEEPSCVSIRATALAMVSKTYSKVIISDEYILLPLYKPHPISAFECMHKRFLVKKHFNLQQIRLLMHNRVTGWSAVFRARFFAILDGL